MGDDTSNKTEPNAGRGEGKRDVTIAIIEHASKPAAYALIGIVAISWLFWVKDPLFQLLKRAQSLQLGPFAIVLQQNIKSANLTGQFNKLQSLNREQILLFLIVGAYRKEMNIRYDGPEVTLENLEKLQDKGLLKDVGRLKNGRLKWSATDHGNLLHGIIVQQLITTIKTAIDDDEEPTDS